MLNSLPLYFVYKKRSFVEAALGLTEVGKSYSSVPPVNVQLLLASSSAVGDRVMKFTAKNRKSFKSRISIFLAAGGGISYDGVETDFTRKKVYFVSK